MEIGLPPPVGRLRGRWLAAGVCQLLIGGVITLFGIAGTDTHPSWSPLLLLNGVGVIASGVLLLKGIRWSWAPSLLLLALTIVEQFVFTAHSLQQPSGSSVEDMRPILAMGGVATIGGILAVLVALASSPRPRGPVPAGWYPDPLDKVALRFWNGEEWSDHSSPAAPPGPVRAGWYLNPEDRTEWRYWDGRRWTDHTAPLA